MGREERGLREEEIERLRCVVRVEMNKNFLERGVFSARQAWFEKKVHM